MKKRISMFLAVLLTVSVLPLPVRAASQEPRIIETVYPTADVVIADIVATEAPYNADATGENDVSSGIVSLGGNVQTIGQKPDGSDYLIAVQDPDDPEGRGIQTQCVAFGDGIEYGKHDANPVITEAQLPEGSDPGESERPPGTEQAVPRLDGGMLPEPAAQRA